MSRRNLVSASVVSFVIIGFLGASAYLLLNTKGESKTKDVAKIQQNPTENVSQYANQLYRNNLDTIAAMRLVSERAKHRALKSHALEFLRIAETENKTLSRYTATPSERTSAENRFGFDTFAASEKLAQLEGDAFDKFFLKFVRYRCLEDSQLAYSVTDSSTKMPKDIVEFAQASIDSRYKISGVQAHWPVKWGYQPPHQ